MSYFNSPFKTSTILKANIFWLNKHILRFDLFKDYKKQAIADLKASGLKREIIDIDRVENMDPKVFRSEYFLKNKPVIFKGAAKAWPCMKWSLDYFKENFGEKDTINTSYESMKVITLAQTIDDIREKKSSAARLCKVMTHHPELMQEADLDYIYRFVPKPSFTTSHQFFIGTEGNFTPLHAGATNNYQIQISGEKIWHLVDPVFNPVINPIIDREPLFKSYLNTEDPDFVRFPEMKYIPILRAHVEPGDILFNPTFYWHQVKYLSESIAVGLRSLQLYNMVRSSMTMATVLATATNPPAVYSFYNIYKGITRPFFK